MKKLFLTIALTTFFAINGTAQESKKITETKFELEEPNDNERAVWRCTIHIYWHQADGTNEVWHQTFTAESSAACYKKMEWFLSEFEQALAN